MQLREEEEKEEEVQMNLTPMIDVVLQLIVFFMLVMDFSSRELEPVVLAKAKNASLDERVEDITVTVNISHRQEVQCDKWTMNTKAKNARVICRDPEHWVYYMGGQGFSDAEQIRSKLASAAQRKRAEDGTSEVPLIVRADWRAPWQFVRQVMQQASHPSVKIYRLKLAAKIPRSAQR